MRASARALVVVAALASAATSLTACTDDPPEAAPPRAESGFVLVSDQLQTPRTDIVGHPDPDRWRVAVAYVRPEVRAAAVLRQRPHDGEEPALSSVRPAEDDPLSQADALLQGLPVSPAIAPSALGRDGGGASGGPQGNAAETNHEERAADRRGSADAATTAEVPGATPDLDAQLAAVRDLPLSPIPSPALSWGSAEIGGHWMFDNPTKIGNPLVFLVVGSKDDWLEVQVPARPNQQTGWIHRDDVTVEHHRWHAEVNATTNRLRVWEGDELKVDTAVVAGTEYTPTPVGRFYINERQQHYPTSAYGSWILSTNGFSNALERFGGEVPIFALHGTPYAESVGQDLSNGCIRIPNPIVEMLATEMPLGTPVDVVI
jgi:hypothetical protein